MSDTTHPSAAARALRRRRASAVLAAVLLATAIACGPLAPAPPAAPPDDPHADPDGPGLEVATLTLVADGLEQPVAFAIAGDGSGRAFVAERRGVVRTLHEGDLTPQPYLDLSALVAPLAGGEQGLLGLAFHPEFADNGRLFVHYVDLEYRSTIAELRAEPPSAAEVDAATLEVLLTVPSVTLFHFGGDLAFGPDGHLYATLGDSGDAARARDPSTLHGSVIRIGVDGTGDAPYLVPADNPFVGTAGADEVWAYGLRNPFRFSFDAGTGDLWIADVGANAVEAVYLERAGDGGGQDYGWPVLEGDRCHDPPEGCSTEGFTMPVLAYGHEQGLGSSVIGGHVYRGDAFPDARGTYVFGDFISGAVFAATEDDGGWTMELLFDTELRIVAFGVDETGELYLLDLGGGVHALVPSEP